MATTLSTTNKNAHCLLSNGNLTATSSVTDGNHYVGRSDATIFNGDKRYWEVTITTLSGSANNAGSGYCNAGMSLADGVYLGSTTSGVGYYEDGNLYFNNAPAVTYETFAQGDVICWAMFGHNSGWVRKNGGNWNNNPAADPATNT